MASAIWQLLMTLTVLLTLVPQPKRKRAIIRNSHRSNLGKTGHFRKKMGSFENLAKHLKVWKIVIPIII